MIFLRIAVIALLPLAPLPAFAQGKEFALTVPEELIATGFLQHLLPRFSLKTGIRITINGATPTAAITTDAGIPVFEGAGAIWRYDAQPGDLTDRFEDWLRSDVGKRTIEAFQLDGAQVFSASLEMAEDAVVAEISGDAVRGETVSLSLCGRCHVINETNRMNAIGSTPSFGVLRTLNNWQDRFEAFYTLNPHPAFTQVANVTPPFAPSRPPPIAPVELTLDDLDAILAYVATITPADLGAPIQSQ